MANTHLSRTPSVEPTSRYKGTLSVWVKRGKADAESFIFNGFESNSNKMKIDFKSDSSLQINTVQAGSNRIVYETNRKFRDVNAWYHIVVAIDTTLATAGDRVRLYVNGVEETSFSTETHPTQNSLHMMTDNGTPIYIGSANGNNYFNGLMSHLHLIDGTQYTASDFGETDATTGEWKIKVDPSVTYGNNGFWILKDGNSVTDASPNTNNLTVSSGTLTKTEDCPSNVFATLNSLDNYFPSSSFSNGNLQMDTGNSNYTFNNATLGYSSGKYYWEAKITHTSNYDHIGITSKGSTSSTNYMYASDYSYVLKSDNGVLKYKAGGSTADVGGWSGASFGVGNIISIAHDIDNNKIYFAKDGVWMNSANPNTPTGGITTTSLSSTDTGVWLPAFGDENNGTYTTWQVNFGNGYFGTTAVSSAGTNASNNGIFEYDVPTGYTALSTRGLNL